MQSLSLFISYANSVLTGAQISPHAAIGTGFAVYHPHGTVIGATAVIGNNCTLTHGNVIGQLYGTGDRPIIGDYFFAGTGAKILGKIKIGDHVHVGANAVIVNSLPDGARAVAFPAKILLMGRPEAGTADHRAHAPAREAILRRLLPLLASAVEVDMPIELINEGTSLLGEGIDLDSIAILRLIGALEQEFRITVDDAEVKTGHFQTVGAMLTFIQERLLP